MFSDRLVLNAIFDVEDVHVVHNIAFTFVLPPFPLIIAFDEAGKRAFTTNHGSNSVSIIDLPTVSKICQDSGFHTSDIRTIESNGQTLQQISCVNFVVECSGNIEDGETRKCPVADYIVALNEVSNGKIDILSNMNKSQQQISTNDISNTENKIKTSPLLTGPFIFDIPKD